MASKCVCPRFINFLQGLAAYDEKEHTACKACLHSIYTSTTNEWIDEFSDIVGKMWNLKKVEKRYLVTHRDAQEKMFSDELEERSVSSNFSDLMAWRMARAWSILSTLFKFDILVHESEEDDLVDSESEGGVTDPDDEDFEASESDSDMSSGSQSEVEIISGDDEKEHPRSRKETTSDDESECPRTPVRRSIPLLANPSKGLKRPRSEIKAVSDDEKEQQRTPVRHSIPALRTPPSDDIVISDDD
jgi:hypothetical protein